MKFSNLLVATTALGQCAGANAVPNAENVALDSRSQDSGLLERELLERVDGEELWKRKGGGGGGGRGGGSTSGGGTRGGSGSSTSGGGRSGGTSGGTGGTSGGTGGTTGGNRGGGSSAGSGSSSPGTGNRGGSGGSARPAPVYTGTRPAYGGGQYYGGGARQPYAAGRSSPGGLGPAGGLAGGLLIGSALGFGAASWAHGAYRYPHKDEYTFHNATTDKQETKPVECLCAKDLQCGCEDNNDKKYLDEIIGNGSYAALNKTLVDVGPVNGKSTIRINGTLSNDTTAENVDDDDSSDAQAILQAAGWWPVITTGLFMAFIV